MPGRQRYKSGNIFQSARRRKKQTAGDGRYTKLKGGVSPTATLRNMMNQVNDLKNKPDADEPLDLAGKHIVLGLSGGIACYKAAELCRALIKEGRRDRKTLGYEFVHLELPRELQ